MTDEEYLAYVLTLDNPVSILKEIVGAVELGLFGHDPYYADLKRALLGQANKVLK